MPQAPPPAVIEQKLGGASGGGAPALERPRPEKSLLGGGGAVVLAKFSTERFIGWAEDRVRSKGFIPNEYDDDNREVLEHTIEDTVRENWPDLKLPWYLAVPFAAACVYGDISIGARKVPKPTPGEQRSAPPAAPPRPPAPEPPRPAPTIAPPTAAPAAPTPPDVTVNVEELQKAAAAIDPAKSAFRSL